MLIIDKVEVHTFQLNLFDTDIFPTPTDTDFKGEEIFNLITKFSIRHVIIGQNNPNLMTSFDQGFGEGANNVSQTTRLGKRCSFCCYK